MNSLAGQPAKEWTQILKIKVLRPLYWLVPGSMAERTKLESYIVFSFLNTVVFSIPSHWTWSSNGWLAKLGVIDIAGEFLFQYIVACQWAGRGLQQTTPRAGRQELLYFGLPYFSNFPVCAQSDESLIFEYRLWIPRELKLIRSTLSGKMIMTQSDWDFAINI